MKIGAYETNQVYNVDALELLKGLPDESVDAIIADPPYGLTELDFDQQNFDWQAFWFEVRRVLKSPASPVVLFSQQPFTTDLICSNRKQFRFEIIYEKTMPTGFLNANRAPLRSHENVLIFSQAAPFYSPVFETTTDRKHHTLKRSKADHYGDFNPQGYQDKGQRFPRTVWRFAQRDTAFKNTKSLHPTQKPLALMERLVETFTPSEALVVDCFAGSGTTLVAAQRCGRMAVGSDTKEACVVLANKRLALPFDTPLFEALP